MGYELVKAVLAERMSADDDPPNLVVEFVDPTSADLLEGDPGIRVLSPRILGHLECHAALPPDLGSVFSELFVGGGVEMVIREHGDHGCPPNASFVEVERAANACGEIALGYVLGGVTPGSFEIEICPVAERRSERLQGRSIVSLARGGENDEGVEASSSSRWPGITGMR